MKSFEEWLEEIEKEIEKANIPKPHKFSLLVKLYTLKTNRTLFNLNYLMRWLRHYGLPHLCPTSEEIDNWIQQGAIGTL